MSATASVATSDPYVCAKCGYRGSGHASLTVRASAAGGSALFGNDRAGEIARDTAEATAWSEALSSIAMAPCPRCGAVDASTWRSWLTRPSALLRWAVGALATIAGALLCASVFTHGRSAFCAGGMGLGLLAGGLLYVLLPILGKRASSRRVRFDPPR